MHKIFLKANLLLLNVHSSHFHIQNFKPSISHWVPLNHGKCTLQDFIIIIIIINFYYRKAHCLLLIFLTTTFVFADAGIPHVSFLPCYSITFSLLKTFTNYRWPCFLGSPYGDLLFCFPSTLSGVTGSAFLMFLESALYLYRYTPRTANL